MDDAPMQSDALADKLADALPLVDDLKTGQDCAEYAYATSKFFQAMTCAPEAFEALRFLPEAIAALRHQARLVQSLKTVTDLLEGRNKADCKPSDYIYSKVRIARAALAAWEATQ